MVACGKTLLRQLHRYSLRVLYNSAITDGLIKQTDYPFDTFKVSRFKEATAKRSLTKEGIRQIMDCDVRTLTKYPKPFLQLAKDLFLFSDLSCGINPTDILHIHPADIVDGRLVINRRKTGKLLSFQLQPAALAILNKYRQPNHTPQDYIFPVLKRSVHVTAQQQYGRVQPTNKRINRYLKLIGEHLYLPITLATYVARHSFTRIVKLHTLIFCIDILPVRCPPRLQLIVVRTLRRAERQPCFCKKDRSMIRQLSRITGYVERFGILSNRNY